MERFKRLLVEDRGIELVEYAVLTALILTVLVVAMAALGGSIANSFSNTADIVAP